jgi:Fur family peroxide stress response transcriptional regulator
VENERRSTRQLEAVWDAVKDESSHPTADQIYEKVRAVIPHISLGTVYRNLQKLVAEGRLQVLTVDRTQRFDPMVKGHDHFICEKCGGVFDAFVDPKKILSSYLPHEGFNVTSHQLTLYGNCRNCSAQG